MYYVGSKSSEILVHKIDLWFLRWKDVDLIADFVAGHAADVGVDGLANPVLHRPVVKGPVTRKKEIKK
jgi:hypothetical protein